MFLFLNPISSLMNYGVIKFPDNFNAAGYMNFVYLELSEMPAVAFGGNK